MAQRSERPANRRAGPRSALRGSVLLLAVALNLAGLVVVGTHAQSALGEGTDAAVVLRNALLAAGIIGVVATALVAWIAATMYARPVRAVTTAARRMVTDLAARTHVQPVDEVGDLAGAIDQIAEARAASLANLEHERDRRDAMLEAMAEGVLVVDPAGAIVVANRAMREMFYVGRDVIGQLPIEAFRNAALHDAIAETSRTRTTVTREIEIDGVRPRRVLARLAPIDDGEGGTVAVLTDMTELRRLETIRRDFVANVSHELRTPIAAVRAAVETLQDGALAKPEPAKEFVSIIERHTQRLQQIVEDLLDLSRIEAKELKLALVAMEVTPAIDRTLDLFRLAAEKKRITLEREVAADLPLVHADARVLDQIVTNLVDNAIKYSPESRAVTVRAVRREGAVRVSVEDNGPGIEARHLPRLFERFYRVDPGRSRQVGGTGLGLAIVKHLAEAIGASVSVESAVGRGTRFHVDLKRAEGAEK